MNNYEVRHVLIVPHKCPVTLLLINDSWENVIKILKNVLIVSCSQHKSLSITLNVRCNIQLVLGYMNSHIIHVINVSHSSFTPALSAPRPFCCGLILTNHVHKTLYFGQRRKVAFTHRKNRRRVPLVFHLCMLDFTMRPTKYASGRSRQILKSSKK